jgi:hypothetical protein
MKTKKTLPNKQILDLLSRYLEKVRHYSFVMFLVFVGLIYAFVLLRLASLSGAEPSATDVTSQVQAAQVPNFNQALVKQIQSLQQDNANVKSLFDQERSNPFQ